MLIHLGRPFVSRLALPFRLAVSARVRPGLAALALALGLGLAAPARAITIVANFDSSITNDTNAATIEATINQAISIYENTFFDPITVTITFQEMGSGLGQSTKNVFGLSYSTFLTALRNDSTSANDATALASLPVSSTNPVTGTSSIYATRATIEALGIPGTFTSTLTGGVDGIIGLNTSIMNLDRTTINPSNYDLLATTEHEIDEVLGLGSLVGVSPTIPMPEDLFRYDNTGSRNYTTSGNNAYFSLNGTTDLVQFNQSGTGDYGDWASGSPVAVQNAFGTPGATPNLGTNEITALDVIGFNTTPIPEPATAPLLFASLTGLGAALLRRTRRISPRSGR